MPAGAVSVYNYLISTYVELLCVLGKVIISRFAVVYGLRILCTLSKNAIVECSYGYAVLISPIFDCSSEAEAGSKTAARNNHYAWAVLFIAPLAFAGIGNQQLYCRSVRLINTALCLILRNASPVIIGKVIFKTILSMCCELLPLFKGEVVIKKHLGIAYGLTH